MRSGSRVDMPVISRDCDQTRQPTRRLENLSHAFPSLSPPQFLSHPWSNISPKRGFQKTDGASISDFVERERERESRHECLSDNLSPRERVGRTEGGGGGEERNNHVQATPGNYTAQSNSLEAAQLRCGGAK